MGSRVLTSQGLRWLAVAGSKSIKGDFGEGSGVRCKLSTQQDVVGVIVECRARRSLPLQIHCTYTRGQKSARPRGTSHTD